MYALQDQEVPTKLKRISSVIEPEVYDALVAYSIRSKRSISNMIAVLIEETVLRTGDLKTPTAKAETRGGVRKGAGRKPKDDESDVEDQSDEGDQN